MNLGKFFFVISTISLPLITVFAEESTDSARIRALEEVIVVGSGAERNLKSAEIGRHSLSDLDISRMPVMFGEPDIVKSLQSLPGVAQGVEGFTGLYVHGGENDQNLFLYNGLPLYHVSHIGGIFSSFNVATIQSIDFYKSSFPARFGDRTSSITTIKMKQPDFDKYTGKVSIGLLAANAYISGPIIKDKLAFSVGARRSWIDVVGLPALAIYNAIQKKNGTKMIAGYSFTDFNARIDYKLDKGSIYLLGYYGYDKLKIGERLFEATNKSWGIDENGNPIEITNGNGISHYDENVNRMSWGNWGISANIDMSIGRGRLNAILYHSRYNSTYEQIHEYQTDMSNPLSYGYISNSTGNSIADLGVKGNYCINFGDNYMLNGGAGYTYHNYHPADIVNVINNSDQSKKELNNNPTVNSNEVYLYLDNDINISHWSSINVGFRYVIHSLPGRTYSSPEPRASIRVNLAPDYSIKASFARIHQFVQQVSNNYINLPTDLWQPVSKNFEPLRSDNYSLGIYGILPWQKIYFAIEGWYKDMRNLTEYKEGVSSLNTETSWEDKLTTGDGWAYGMDINLTKDIGRLTGNIGYGLMWNWRKFEELNGGIKFPAKFDNRHKININLTYKFNEQIEFNAGWTYMTGNRMTLALYNYDDTGNLFPDAPTEGLGTTGADWEQSTGIDYIDERNNVRMPDYHRLDLGVSIYKNYKNGRRGIWNFGLYNAYCYMNTMTIVKRDYYSGERTFEKFSLLPIVPSVSYTYEF